MAKLRGNFPLIACTGANTEVPCSGTLYHRLFIAFAFQSPSDEPITAIMTSLKAEPTTGSRPKPSPSDAIIITYLKERSHEFRELESIRTKVGGVQFRGPTVY